MFEDRERTVLPEPQDGAPRDRTDAWRPSVDRDSYDAAIARIREHIAAGDTYQVNHTLRLRLAGAGRRAGPLPRPVLRAARRVRRVPEPRALPGALGLPGVVLPHRRRPHHDEADEGNGAPGALVGRGRRGGGRPAGIGEGSGRERDDRRPAPQRHGKGRSHRHGDLERRVRPRALRDRVAAHVDGLGRPRAGDSVAGRRLPGALPVRLRHGRAQGPDDGDHRRAGGFSAAACTAERSASSPRAVQTLPPRGSACRSARCCSMPRATPPSTGSGAESRGGRAPRASTTRRSRRRRC